MLLTLLLNVDESLRPNLNELLHIVESGYSEKFNNAGSKNLHKLDYGESTNSSSNQVNKYLYSNNLDTIYSPVHSEIDLESDIDNYRSVNTAKENFMGQDSYQNFNTNGIGGVSNISYFKQEPIKGKICDQILSHKMETPTKDSVAVNSSPVTHNKYPFKGHMLIQQQQQKNSTKTAQKLTFNFEDYDEEDDSQLSRVSNRISISG
jgi:hypothetical protein